MKNTRRSLILAAPAAFALMACGQAGASIPSSQAATVDAALKYGKGFTVGKADSDKHLVVFFDPNCIHCALFWRETKELQAIAKFTWLPVSFIKPDGVLKGANFLGMADPRAAMDEHAQDMIARKIGAVPADTRVDLRAAVVQNGKLLDSFGANQIPYLVGTNLKTNAAFTQAGGMSKHDLINKLGWGA
ncbi:thioredoxin fold domain-containing protein [Comamonas thiooxydans]|uniref:thioredoxin fold domain-containing protein n=1 Tax=Comamonas thiooxydans TaxID=363952 RepID=UPI000B4205C8|nr:thioredoxin fold domain-containing protein [Comamonas thiooxydans]